MEKESPTACVCGSGGRAHVFSSVPSEKRLKFSKDALTMASKGGQMDNETLVCDWHEILTVKMFVVVVVVITAILWLKSNSIFAFLKT